MDGLRHFTFWRDTPEERLTLDFDAAFKPPYSSASLHSSAECVNVVEVGVSPGAYTFPECQSRLAVLAFPETTLAE
jgi:hypothetical protein